MATSFEIAITPRFRDTDMIGHVNNAVFLTYLELGRSEWYRGLGHEPPTNFSFILARVEIDYRSPILLGSQPLVQMWVPEIGNKSWKFSYIIKDRDTGKVYAEASSVQVMFDYKANVTIPIPDELRKELQYLSGS